MSSTNIPSLRLHDLAEPATSAKLRSLVPVSVIILTFNEERNISDCVRSLDWADEVMVVDSGSIDATTAIAVETRPDLRVFQHAFKDFGDQRNWALDKTSPRNSWVLFLDADERCTPKLAEAIRSTLEHSSDVVGYYMCYRNFFLGRWIKRCTRFPTWQLRLLKHGEVRYQKMGHGQREVTTGRLDYLHEPYDHYGFSQGIAHWIARHNHYSSEELDHILELRIQPLRLGELFSRDGVIRTRCMKRIASRIPFRPLASFLYLYIWRLGFLDGYAGFLFCILRFTHEIHMVVKLEEKQQAENSKLEIRNSKPEPPIDL